MCEFESLGSIVRRLMLKGWAADAGEAMGAGSAGRRSAQAQEPAARTKWKGRGPSAPAR